MRLPGLLGVVGVVTLTLIGCKSGGISADQGGQLSMKEARKQAAHRQRRIIFNDDGCYGRPFDTIEKFYKARLLQTVDTQVDSVFYCTGATTMFTHLARVGETYGEFIPEDASAYAKNIATGIRSLRQSGHDTLALATDFCHRNGMEIIWTLRMNDIHDAFLDWELTRWKREHPEYMIGKPEDMQKYPGSDPRHWWSSLDYEIPEVRDYIYRILKDVCERYDVDGIELDWWRSPMFRIMNDFVRRVRRMTEQIGQRRGRPLLVSCRVPLSIERSRFVGLDVPTWLEEDLVDILTLGGGYVPMAMAPQVREMADFAHQYDVPVYACISASGLRGHFGNVESWRGAAMNIWHAGADGVLTFNFFPAERDERLSQLGSAETLKGLDKIYGIDRMVAETFEGDLRPGLVAPNRLPIELQVGSWVAAHMPVGEDIVANTPEGKAAHTRLRLQVSNLARACACRYPTWSKARKSP